MIVQPCSYFRSINLLVTYDMNIVKLTIFFLFTSHGISCAGIISAMANNSFCGVGIAYSAKIGGECRLYPGGLIVIDLVNSSIFLS